MISKFNKGLRVLLCTIDLYSKYTWVIPLKDKKAITIIIAFQKTLNKSNRKPNKIYVNKGNEFSNRQMKLLLQNNDTEMYSTYYAGKSAVAKRFSRTLKNLMYKYVTSVSKNVYIDKLDDIVNK